MRAEVQQRVATAGRRAAERGSTFLMVRCERASNWPALLPAKCNQVPPTWCEARAQNQLLRPRHGSRSACRDPGTVAEILSHRRPALGREQDRPEHICQLMSRVSRLGYCLVSSLFSVCAAVFTSEGKKLGERGLNTERAFPRVARRITGEETICCYFMVPCISTAPYHKIQYDTY